MFNIQRCGNAGGDGTAPYEVVLDRAYTVRTFIAAILTERSTEWGNIKTIDGSGNSLCNYDYDSGKLKNAADRLDQRVLDKAVTSVKASGGWTCTDYLIIV